MLSEVVLIRLILILQLIVYHAFIIFRGGWNKPVEFVDIPLYHQIADWSYAFLLETFVAISGYLFYYQRYERGKRLQFVPFIKNKLGRLILPSIIFTILYISLFYDFKSVGDTIYTIFNGAGHMWFLPMLFWVYLGGWYLTKLKLSHSYIVTLLLPIALFSFVPLPLRLNTAMYYMLFFYLGMNLRHHIRWFDTLSTCNIFSLWGGFVILFSAWQLMESFMVSSDGYIWKMFTILISKLCRILYASVGVVAIFSTALHFANCCSISTKLVKLSGYCFGIYLFQQFILQILYYKLNISIYTGIYTLPWVALIITFVLSLLLVHLALKTKIGKYLIG